MKRVGTFSVLVLLILCLVVTPTIQAAKPLEKYVDIEHFEEDGAKGIMKVTVIVYGVEDGVYHISMTAVVSARMYSGGEVVGTVKVSMHYRGTSTGTLDAELITGKLTYELSSTGQAESAFGDGHWVIWYEEGEPVREIGRGELWFP